MHRIIKSAKDRSVDEFNYRMNVEPFKTRPNTLVEHAA